MLSRRELSDSRGELSLELLLQDSEADYLRQGLRIPKVLQPYMQGRDFIPYTAELPKGSTSNKKK